MFVLVVVAVAAGFGLVVLGILGYGLYGQLNRLRRAVEETSGDVLPKLAALRPHPPGGRHRAG